MPAAFFIALGATATAAAVYSAIAYVAITAASIIYSRQQAKKAQRNLANSMRGLTVTSRDPAAARRLIYGTQKVGGTFVFIGASGNDNEYLHMVIAYAGHKVSAMGDVYFDDELVPFDMNGNATGRLAGFAFVEKFSGDPDQQASLALIAAFPGQWTSAHRLRGVAYMHVRLKYDSSKFTREPNVTVVIDGKRLYDPRTGATVFSHNPALAWRDYMSDKTCGLGCDAEEIDDGSVIIAANICDERVALVGGGYEARYACDGCVDTSAKPSEIMDDFLSCMAGWAIYTGGLWDLRAGAHQVPTAHFTIDDMRGEVVVQGGDSLRDTCNAVKGVYVSPQNKWQATDFPPVKNQYYFEQDNNERIWRDVEYPFTISPAGAQRLAKIELEQARQSITCKLQLKLCGLRVKAGDVVELSVERYGFARKQFEVTAWKFSVENAEFSTGGVDGAGAPTLGVDVELRETASGVWDWNAGEETVVDLAPNVNLPDPLASPNPSGLTLRSGSDVLLRGSDGSIVSRILATWNLAPSVFVQSGGRYELEYRRTGAADWMPGGGAPGYMPRAYIGPVEDGVRYDVRLRSVNNVGAVGGWIESGGHTVVGKTAAPGAPSGLVAEGMAETIALSWTNCDDVDLRGVEISERMAETPAPVAGTVATAFVSASRWISGVIDDGDERFYWVRSVDTSGNKSAWVGPSSASIGGGAPVKPDAPLVVAAGGFGQIVLSWSQPGLANVKYWEVYTGENPGEEPFVTVSGISSAIHILSGLGGAVTRYARVRAIGRGDLPSDWSAEASATTMQVDAEALRDEVDKIKEGLQTVEGDLTREITERKQAVAAIADEMGNYATLAALTEEKLLRADVDAALARDIAKTIATMNDSVAAVIRESEARVTALNAMARDMASVVAILGDNHAAVQVLSEAYVDAMGKAVAKWGVTVDAGGVITGIEAISQNGAQPVSEVRILAQVFKIISTGTNGKSITPFVVKNGNVYIDTAFIEQVDIGKLTGGTITGKEIILSGGGKIRSANFKSGESGWQISDSGAEFPTLLVRSQNIEDGAVTFTKVSAAGTANVSTNAQNNEGDTWHDVSNTGAMSLLGRTVRVAFSGVATASPGNSSGATGWLVQARLLRNGSVVAASSEAYVNSGTGSIVLSISHVDVVSAGNHTYSAQVRGKCQTSGVWSSGTRPNVSFTNGVTAVEQSKK